MSKRNTLVGPQLQRGRTGFNPDWKRLIAFLMVIVWGRSLQPRFLRIAMVSNSARCPRLQ
jgi:hypothetical protein